jgi:hypothetical protein
MRSFRVCPGWNKETRLYNVMAWCAVIVEEGKWDMRVTEGDANDWLQSVVKNVARLEKDVLHIVQIDREYENEIVVLEGDTRLGVLASRHIQCLYATHLWRGEG